ncbi:MAG: hypothetical protein U5K00_12240 [Melioribacteraceae bacterium]|nr:hypothetical protein [Melioribacteraceae bacterium]
MGQNRNILFEDVTADGNGLDGFYMVHVNFGTFNNLIMTNNGLNGLNVDASQHLEFEDGTFDNNGSIGIAIAPVDARAHTFTHDKQR